MKSHSPLLSWRKLKLRCWCNHKSCHEVGPVQLNLCHRQCNVFVLKNDFPRTKVSLPWHTKNHYPQNIFRVHVCLWQWFVLLRDCLIVVIPEILFSFTPSNVTLSSWGPLVLVSIHRFLPGITVCNFPLLHAIVTHHCYPLRYLSQNWVTPFGA